MIRILIAEDQAMVRGALRALLAMEDDIQVVGEVARADEVVAAALASRPDIALMDIEMPGGDGISAAAALHAQFVPIPVPFLNPPRPDPIPIQRVAGEPPASTGPPSTARSPGWAP